jgi:hypothetical protein
MGVLASESVVAHFEQSAHIAALESNYHEAVELAAEEAEALTPGSERVVAAPFQQEEVPAK